jgi:hypothetical protein
MSTLLDAFLDLCFDTVVGEDPKTRRRWAIAIGLAVAAIGTIVAVSAPADDDGSRIAFGLILIIIGFVSAALWVAISLLRRPRD